MYIPSFTELNVFVKVAEHASFAKAAARLDVSISTVSVTIRTLENQLGVRLFNRTTRSVALTEVGNRLLAQWRPLSTEYLSMIESICDLHDKPTGLLRLFAHTSTANYILVPLMTRFLAEYPDITVEVSTDPSNNNIVGEHFDAGIQGKRRI